MNGKISQILTLAYWRDAGKIESQNGLGKRVAIITLSTNYVLPGGGIRTIFHLSGL